MSLEAVRRLAWTSIILFITAMIFAANRGPIFAWLAANHGPLLAGIIQSPLWAIAFLLIIPMLLCVIGIMADDKTPFAIGMHTLGIMMPGVGEPRTIEGSGLLCLPVHKP